MAAFVWPLHLPSRSGKNACISASVSCDGRQNERFTDHRRGSRGSNSGSKSKSSETSVMDVLDRDVLVVFHIRRVFTRVSTSPTTRGGEHSVKHAWPRFSTGGPSRWPRATSTGWPERLALTGVALNKGQAVTNATWDHRLPSLLAEAAQCRPGRSGSLPRSAILAALG